MVYYSPKQNWANILLMSWSGGPDSEVEFTMCGSVPYNRASGRFTGPRPSIRYPKPSYRELVPGGWWFLIAYPAAVMHALSLDDTNPVPRVLYNPTEFDPGLSSCKNDISYFLD